MIIFNMTNHTTTPSNISTTSIPPCCSDNTLQMIKKISYFIIAIVALLGNLLVTAFFIQNRKTLLKKTYYLVLLALSITDILTAIFLLATPAFLFDSGLSLEPTNRIALLIFCKVLWGRLILFIFGVASVYLILLLTIDRWIAVMKHTHYKTLINRSRVVKGIALSYILGVVFILPSHPNIEVFPNKPSGQRCSFVSTPYLKYTVTINFMGKAVVPFVAITVMYIQIVLKIKSTSQGLNQNSSIKEPRKKITRIAIISSVTILLCWLPNQINLLLYSYGKSTVQSSFHDFTVGLVFLTSCINPFLYGLTSKKFRKGYVVTLSNLTPCRSASSTPGSQPTSNSQIAPCNDKDTNNVT